MNNNRFKACLRIGEGPQVGEVTCGGSPHPSCKRDQIIMRDYIPHLPGVSHLHVNRPLARAKSEAAINDFII